MNGFPFLLEGHPQATRIYYPRKINIRSRNSEISALLAGVLPNCSIFTLRADAALVVASRQPDDKSLEFAYFSLESFEGRAAGGSVVSIVSIVIGHEGQNISEISSKISIF